MYPKPHNKIYGRDLIGKKDEGIKICLDTINDPESHRDDILSATCYMGYRVMDGSYPDKDFIYQKILEGHELSKTISVPNDPAWFRVRWEASYLMLRIYFEYLVLDKPFPKDLATELTNIKIEDHPPQFVNMQRGFLFLFLDALRRNDTTEMDRQVLSALAAYKRAVGLYPPPVKSPQTFIYECWEATECLTLMMEFKFTPREKQVEKMNKETWKDKSNDKSRGNMHKVINKLYL